MIEESIKANTRAVEHLTQTLQQLLSNGGTVATPIKTAEARSFDPEHTLDDVRAAMSRLDRETALAILAQYDVKKISDLSASAYGNVIKNAQARLKAA